MEKFFKSFRKYVAIYYWNMPPTPTRHRQLCGIHNHYLEGEPVYITDPKHIQLVQLANKEFRASWPLCKPCADSLGPTLELKKQRLREFLKRKRPPDVSSSDISSTETSSVGDLDSSSSRIDISSSSEDEQEREATRKRERMARVAAARERARREFERKRNQVMSQYAGSLLGG